MKYVLALAVFTFTGFIVWTAGTYAVEIEDLKALKVKIDNTRTTTPEERQVIFAARKAKALALAKIENKNKGPLHEEREVEDWSEFDDSYNLPELPHETLMKLEEKFTSDSTQESENVVVQVQNGGAKVIKAEVSEVKEISEYKTKVLSKLFSNKPASSLKAEVGDIDEAEAVPLKVPGQTPFLFPEQLASETTLNLLYEDFNFSKETKLKVDLTSLSTNNKLLPNVRLTIENSQGFILVEDSTDLKGKFSKEMTVFTGEKLYVRYYGVGMPQDKIEIKTGGQK